MEHYVNITLDLSLLGNKHLDLRVSSTMTLKEMLQIVVEAYEIDVVILNPTVRIIPSGQVLASTSLLNGLRNGMLLKLETV